VSPPEKTAQRNGTSVPNRLTTGYTLLPILDGGDVPKSQNRALPGFCG